MCTFIRGDDGHKANQFPPSGPKADKDRAEVEVAGDKAVAKAVEATAKVEAALAQAKV